MFSNNNTDHSVADTVDLERDEMMSEVPIDNDGHGASLPTPEEVRMTVGSTTRRRSAPRKCSRKFLTIVAIGAIVLAIIVGVAVGVSRARQQEPQGRRATLEDVQLFLEQQGVSDPALLQWNETNQYRAAQWLADVDERNLPIPKETDTQGDIFLPFSYQDEVYHYVSRYVLALLWYELNGTYWHVQTSWLSKEDICHWNDELTLQLSSGAEATVRAGAYCKYQNPETRDVIQLSALFLEYNNLEGRIPTEIAYLSTLNIFAVEENSLQGDFGPELCELTDLISLTMMNNELEGSLPSCLSEMTRLQQLVLSGNDFEGELPDISQLSNMRFLFLDNNRLTGDLTTSLENMNFLRVLYLDDNDFTGVIGPDFLHDHPMLLRVDLSANEFNGSFPGHLFDNSIGLQVLDIHDNWLNGPIDTDFSYHPNMLFLAMHDNDFSGEVPSSIQNLTNLFHLDLSINDFTGDMPDFFDKMTRLNYLFLSENDYFTPGPIPTTLGALSNLEELSLKGTLREGPIPEFLGTNLTNLILLDLDNNNLNDTIPENLGDLTNLQFLLLNRNPDLSGQVPASFSQLSALRLVYLDNTNLEGSMETLCALPTLTETSGDEDGEEIVSADCGGSFPQMTDCPCCDFCCDKDNNIATCHDDFGTPNLKPNWEYGFDRYDFDFGDGETYFEARKYVGRLP